MEKRNVLGAYLGFNQQRILEWNNLDDIRAWLHDGTDRVDIERVHNALDRCGEIGAAYPVGGTSDALVDYRELGSGLGELLLGFGDECCLGIA